MKIRDRFLFVGVINVLFIILFSVSLIAAESPPDDPIVPGDDIPVLGDDGPNIPKNEPEPMPKNITPRIKNITPPYVPPPEMLALWEEFKQNYGEKWTIKWNDITGTPLELRGTYPTSITINDEETLEEVARQFIIDNEEFLKVDADDLNFTCEYDCQDLLQRKDRRRNMRAIFFQYYDGIIVYTGVVDVRINSDAEIKKIDNRFYPDINISIIPTLTKEEVLEMVIEDYDPYLLNITQIDVENDVELFIVPILNSNTKSYDYFLTWRISPKVEPNDFYVDANNGNIVYIYNRIDSFGPIYTGEKICTDIKTTKNNAHLISAILIILFFVLIIGLTNERKRK